ncbi:MAG: sortase [Candidatus Shapirobacteria bacterium]
MIDFFKITPKKRKVKIKSKKGIIYNNPGGPKRYLFYVGTIVVLFSFLSFGYLYWPIGKSLINYKFHTKEAEVKLESFPVQQSIYEYNIQIPKILASSEVIPNISPFNPKEYLKVLENNVVAQAKGSYLPGLGKGKTTYVFAHSSQQGLEMTRKNAVFYLLGKMNENDLIYIKYNGQVYTYKTYMKKVIKASETGYINYKDENKEVLILQTCWPIGTDWKRLLIFAERI